MNSKRIIIVDQNDNPIGFTDKNGKVLGELFRCSALWVTNADGLVLLARRSANKMRSPLRWGPAVVGTLEEGDDYYSNIIKETEEELGLRNIEPRKGPKKLISGVRNYFCQFYTLEVNGTTNLFSPNPDEVAEIRWFTKKEIIDTFNESPE